MARPASASLRWRFVAVLLLATLLPTGILAGVHALLGQASLEELGVEKAVHLLDAHALVLDRELARATGAIETLAHSQEVLHSLQLHFEADFVPASALDQLRAIRDGDRLCADIRLLDPAGQPIAATSSHAANRALAPVLDAAGAVCFSPFYFVAGEVRAAGVIGITSSQDDALLGWLVYELDARALFESLRQVDFPSYPQAFLFVVDEANRLLSHPSHALRLAPSQRSDLPPSLFAGARAEGTLPWHEQTIREVDCVLSLRHLPGRDWVIGLVIPQAAFYRPVAAHLRTTLWIGLACLLVGCALAWWFSARITRPLIELTTSVEDLRAGRTVHVGAYGDDEIGRLAEAFASLSEALRKRTADLVRKNRELEDLASIAAHDLSEPLRKVMLFSDRLDTTVADRLDAREKRFMDRMHKAVAVMSDRIEALLELSRVATQTRRFAPVPLREVVDAALARLAGEIEATGAEVDIGALPTVHGDFAQLRQLFGNLLDNALKFRRAEVPPRIEVRARAQRDDPRSTNGVSWEVEVDDNGIGIEPRHAERVFKPFARLHGAKAYSGVGIGLTISKKIAGRHGGELRVESREAGTRLVCELPELPFAELEEAEDAGG